MHYISLVLLPRSRTFDLAAPYGMMLRTVTDNNCSC